ncbi:excisionase family DNA-binding protein [Arcobacter sp.]|uniref:excisionase family DNA-binding protein n=1 Tax=unclassified Arcobacter TaxID=2593671 RepID=UPI003B00236F
MLIAVDENRLDEMSKIQADILHILQNNKLLSIEKSSEQETTLNLLSVKQSAQYLNVSEIMIRKMIEKKELKVKRIGSAIRIEKCELENIIK